MAKTPLSEDASAIRPSRWSRPLGGLVTAFCIVLLSALSVGAWQLHRHERQLIVGATMQETANLARAFEEHVLSTFRAADANLVQMIGAYQREGAMLDLARLVRESGMAREPYQTFSIVGPDGRLLHMNLPFSTQPDIRGTENFRHHAAGPSKDLFISKPRKGMFTGRWSIYLSRRIDRADGTFGGMAVLALDQSYLSGFYRQIDLGAGGVVTLAGRDGIVRARRTEGSESAGQNLSADAAFGAILAAGSGSGVLGSSVDGIRRIASYRVMSDYPLVLFVGRAEDSVLAAHEARWSAYIGVAVVLGLLVAAFVVLLNVQLGRVARASERLEASEKALLESQERSRHILDSVFGFIGLYDLDGTMVEVNDAPLKTANLRRGDVIGRKFWDTWWWSHSPVAQDMLKEVMSRAAQGARVRFDVEVRVAEGKFITMDAQFTPLRDSGGSVVQLVGYGVNITDRKNAEEALRRHDEQLGILWDSLPIAVGHADLDERITFVNSVYRKYYGTAPDPVGRTIREAVGEERYAGLEPSVRRALAGEEVAFDIETAREGVPSVKRWVRYIPDRDAAGVVVGFFALIEDVTYARAAEQAVRESHEGLEKIFDASPDSITLVTLDGGRFVQASHGFEAFTGWSPAEVIGRTGSDLGLWTDPAQRDFLFAELRAGRIVRDLEAVIRRKDGQLRTGLRFATVIEIGGIPHVLSVMRDITGRKHTEAKLEASLREKDVLLKEIYHRVKNNLQVVASLLNMQSRKAGPEGRTLLKESADRVKSMALVHEQLYRSRDLSSIALEVYANRLVEHLAQSHRPASSQVQILTSIGENVMLPIETAVPLGLIINELVSNAFKHAYAEGAGGDIRIEVRRLGGMELQLSVSDDGRGLPEGFEPGQAPSLGMQLVVTLTGQIGGTLHCLRGRGARFEIRFPIEGQATLRSAA